MKNTLKLFGIITLIAAIGFSFTACDDGGGNNNGGVPQTVTYTGASGGTTYTLKITENTARYAAQSGDAYELTVGSKKSTGTVSNAAGGVLTLKPSNASTTFTATVSGSSLTALNGTVTWTDNNTETAPGAFTPGGGTDITNVPGAGLAAKLQWLKSNAESDTEYLVEVNADEAIAPHELSYSSKTGIAVTIKGVGTERTISLTQNGAVFTVKAGVTLTLSDNITLSGGGTNTAALIEINDNGKLIMKDGAKLTNNQNRGVYLYGENTSFVMDGGEITDNSCGASYGGGVFVSYGTFVMNGGLIARNKYSNTVGGGGGVSVQSGTFTMNGGKISDNTVENNVGTGGGVSIDLGTFTMTGGEISGNKITAWDNPAGDGGGVSSNGMFTMSGGVIKGNSARYGGGVQIHSGVFEKTATGGIIYGSDGGENANTATNNETSGSAIYVYSYGGYVHRETTVSANERLYVSHNPRTNEGAWEVYE